MRAQGTKQGAQVIPLRRNTQHNHALVAGLVSGDPVATAALYDRFGDLINRYIWRLLGADQEHDDVVHQVFINILSSAKKIRNPSSLEDWIIGVTINTARREIRNRKYRRMLIPTPEPLSYAKDSTDTSQQLMTRRVFAILRQMKTDDHIAFILRFVEGHTLGEVAVAAGYSLATAKRRIARAKKEFLERAKKDVVLAALIQDKAR
ncbi:MAG: sigma-70 family RNA polymerase sigma factor [Myxococcota bacterium]|nr:sigma-70 family RNA polymerase sigma factor [Myxococcota bacterium]